MNFPNGLTAEEKELKEVLEKLKRVRKAVGTAAKNMASSSTTIAAKVETRVNKKSIEDAEFATAEVKKKIMSGVITVKKANEKQVFKRANKKKDVVPKMSMDGNESGGNSSGGELMSPSHTTTPSHISSIEAGLGKPLMPAGSKRTCRIKDPEALPVNAFARSNTTTIKRFKR